MTDRQKQADVDINALLRERAQAGSAMPWLDLRVTSQVELRERARQWLAQNGASGRGLQWSLGTLVSARMWQTLGVLLLAAALAGLLLLLPATAPLLRSLGASALLTAGTVLATLAVALVHWQRLRQFYG